MAKNKYKSDEGFYETKGGGRDDETFHEEILSSKEGQEVSRRQSMSAAAKRGLDPQLVSKLYDDFPEE